jgi:hypothetical protein
MDYREKIISRHTVPGRPGVYFGTHFYDSGDSFLWATGIDGEKCGEDNWFTVNKVDGDVATDEGACSSGLDWWKISLVTGVTR